MKILHIKKQLPSHTLSDHEVQGVTMNPNNDDNTNTLMELFSSPLSSIIEQVGETQKSRNKARLNPLSSSPTSSPTRHKTQSLKFHHITDKELSQRGSVINSRNKHNKIRQVRSQHRYEKLLLQREKVTDKQYKEDVEREYDEQAREFMDNEDINRLIDDEWEIINENKRSSLELEEAEARAWEEEMELMELIDTLDLNGGSWYACKSLFVGMRVETTYWTSTLQRS